MENQVTNNANALRLFFTDDVFVVEDKSVKMPLFASTEVVSAPEAISDQSANEQLESNSSTPLPSIKVGESTKIDVPAVEIPPVMEEIATKKEFKFLGGNKKAVLILVNDNNNDVSTEQGRELLRKIVKAINLSTPDFALVNYSNYPNTDFIALREFFKPVIMLSFGVEISELKLNLSWQNEIIVHETTKIIFAPNLHHLDSNIAAKKQLWGHLQKLY
ncbi:hypothetical protein [Pedobacter endophyticus]|uniref:DNA polymerase III psi subunit n=1 Tax=Pedobacter endophyticus TaxID=2789740 RepID=A0A7S9L2Y5_9SPHI|nr:hypothetical protein [Pedobacter endophyticus]QPH41519.1 hypothetical protein IZT61_09785 [Pedobacter endophyticus]